MPNNLAQLQAKYLQFLCDKAARTVAETSPDAFNFDPQGRVLVDVEVNLEEIKAYVKDQKLAASEVTDWVALDSLEALHVALGLKGSPSTITTVSVDIDSNETLKAAFTAKLTDPGLSEKQIDAYLNSPRGSVIALHQEMRFHMAGAKRVLAKLLAQGNDEEDNALLVAELDQAFIQAEAALNEEIMAIFKAALKSSFKDDELNIATLNQALDKARKALGPQAHALLLENIADKTQFANLIPADKKAKKKLQDDIKHLAEATTATPNDILIMDAQLGTATLIAGTDQTAHHRALTPEEANDSQPSFAHRQIVTHALIKGKVSASNNSRIRIRTPSPVVKDSNSDKASKIADVARKFKEVKVQYQLDKRLTSPDKTSDIPRAFIYNRFTAINQPLDGKNKQSESAKLILQGMHVFNKGQRSINGVYAFVQNISVNGFGCHLAYDSNSVGKRFGYEKNSTRVVSESTLMAEVALLHTLYASLPENEKAQAKKVFANYNTFLENFNSDDPSYFFDSPQGNLAREKIEQIKKAVIQANNTPAERNAPEDAESSIEVDEDENVIVTQAKQTLLKMLASNCHFNHQYAKLIQSLSVFVELASIGGCKSGNERAEAITKRVALFDSLLVDSDNAAIEAAKNNLKLTLEQAASNPSNETFNALDSALNSALNAIGLQSATSVISHTDQLSGAKVQPKLAKSRSLKNLNTNRAEDESLTNLQQNHAAGNQAHKGFSGNMLRAIHASSMSEQPVIAQAHDTSNAVKTDIIGADALKKQIGVYLDDHDKDNHNKSGYDQLSDTGKKLLHPREQEKKVDSKTAREEFIDDLANRINDVEDYQVQDPDIRQRQPTKATITLEALLGVDGVRLFKEAMKEEVQSVAYRRAVFNASATFYPGDKWQKTPVIEIAGSSGGGKTTATKAVIKAVESLFGKKAPQDKSGNFVVASDGGVVREVCQMRNLVIEAAVAKGYTGISDLQKETKKSLSSIKEVVREAALTNPELGLAIPETYADPFKWESLYSQIKKLKDSEKTHVFISVEGQSVKFQKAVQFMGENRAFKRYFTADYQQVFNLNRDKGVNIPESKVYEPWNYKWGKWFSRVAKAIFKYNSKKYFCIIAKQDLVLKCPDLNNSGEWMDAEPNSPGVLLISERVFARWQRFKKLLAENKTITITKENLKKSVTPPSKKDLMEAASDLAKFIDISNQISKNNPVKDEQGILLGNTFLPPIIQTSAEVKMAITVKKFKEYVGIRKESRKKKAKKFENLIEEVNRIIGADNSDFSQLVKDEKRREVEHLLSKVKEEYNSLKKIASRQKKLRSTFLGKGRLSLLKQMKDSLEEVLKTIELNSNLATVEQGETVISGSPAPSLSAPASNDRFIYAALTVNDTNNSNQPVVTRLDNQHLKKLQSAHGLAVVSPSNMSYRLFANSESNVVDKAVLKKSYAKATTNETKQSHQQRLAKTIINMIDNVVCHNPCITMTTSSAFEASIARLYIELLKKNGLSVSLSVTVSGFESSATNPSASNFFKPILSSQAIFKALNIESRLTEAPWFKAAIDTQTNSLSPNSLSPTS